MLTRAIRVLLVEDEEISRLGLCMLLRQQTSIELIAAVANFEEAVTINKEQKPDVILLDLYLEDGDVSKRIPRLKQTDHLSKIILFTSATIISQPHVLAFQNGAQGLVIKNQAFDRLLTAIETVYRGEMWIDRGLTSDLIEQLRNPLKAPFSATDSHAPHELKLKQSGQMSCLSNELIEKLTKRELLVSYYASQGFSAKKIANRLSISEKTVRNNLTAIYYKLQVTNQVELCLKIKSTDFLISNDVGIQTLC